MKIEIIKCLEDNYSYLLIDEESNSACVIDPSESKPIIKEYQTNRKNEYPEIGDQLDMLWHSIDQDAALKQKYFAFHQAILAVKSKYPK